MFDNESANLLIYYLFEDVEIVNFYVYDLIMISLTSLTYLISFNNCYFYFLLNLFRSCGYCSFKSINYL